MGRLVSLGLMLLVGVLVYNYFLGDEVEQQKSNVVNSKLYNALKDAAAIEDNRAKSQVQ